MTGLQVAVSVCPPALSSLAQPESDTWVATEKEPVETKRALYPSVLGDAELANLLAPKATTSATLVTWATMGFGSDIITSARHEQPWRNPGRAFDRHRPWWHLPGILPANHHCIVLIIRKIINESPTTDGRKIRSRGVTEKISSHQFILPCPCPRGPAFPQRGHTLFFHGRFYRDGPTGESLFVTAWVTLLNSGV